LKGTHLFSPTEMAESIISRQGHTSYAEHENSKFGESDFRLLE